MANNIYDYIVEQENAFQQPISVNGWSWNFKDHIQQAFYYKHGRLIEGQNGIDPVRNITKPILNVQYRAEDVDVKDIHLYVDDPEEFHLSFLVKKFHDDVFTVKYDLESWLNEWKEQKIDYGVGITTKTNGPKPDVRDLQSVAFCDQTDITKAPIGFRYYFTPAELKDMEEKGWGDPKNGATVSIDELIVLSQDHKNDNDGTEKENKTTSNYIEVYEVMNGSLPISYLDDSGEMDKFDRQYHIAAFYRTKEGNKTGVSLFRKRETEERLKITVRDKIYSRCAGHGGVEEIAEDQVGANNDIIRMEEMLEGASKTILKAVGADLKSRYPNGLKDMQNLQILELNEGEDIGQIDTTPRSMALFENSLAKWEAHAQTMGSAQDPLLGKDAPSGTPFRAQERQVIEGKGIHEYRQEKYAKDVQMVYQDWIIPYIQKEITKGTKFLTELSTAEMQFVLEKVVDSRIKEIELEMLFSGQPPTKEGRELLRQQETEKFAKGGNKVFLEALKDEFKKKPLAVKINVAGKQKDLQGLTDKFVNVFRQIIANPQGFQQAMQIPEMAQAFNNILEFGGMSPVQFAGLAKPAPEQVQQPQQQQGVTPELEALQTQPQ